MTFPMDPIQTHPEINPLTSVSSVPFSEMAVSTPLPPIFSHLCEEDENIGDCVALTAKRVLCGVAIVSENEEIV